MGGVSTKKDIPGADNLSASLGVPRRQFLAGIGAAAAALALTGRNSAAQEAGSNPGWIDVHTHFSTPHWAEVFAAKARKGYYNADSIAPETAKAWNVTELLTQMDRGGVSVSVLSMTFPGVWFGENEDPAEFVRSLARECNDAVAKMVSDHPKRLGLFAVLPLPDIDASLREIEYVFDKLKADGVGLLTSYGNKWLGDPLFAPVFQELNRRKAVVYTHPLQYKLYGPGGADTVRTLTSLLKDGTSTHYPDIRFIFSHGGGFMPYRIENFIGRGDIPKMLANPAPAGTPLAELRRFYYDTAQSANPVTLGALRKVVPLSQIMFGTDYNYAVTDLSKAVKQLQERSELTSEEARAIGRENALKLLPRFKT
jgi:predicted TIM-barrel fold metal-dependent hydrolase